jgi:phage gp36-like protein
MRYLTVDEVKSAIPSDVLARITDDDPSHSITQKVIDDSKIESAILWAEAYVDSQLAKRYVVPLELTTLGSDGARDLIKEAVIQMTIYRLYARVEQEAVAKDKRELADRTLADLASGKIELPGAEERARARIRYRATRTLFSTNTDEEQ